MKRLMSLFLFQRRPEGSWSRRKKIAFWGWNAAILLCAAAGVTGVMLLLAPGDYTLRVFLGYFTHPILFMLNFIPVALLMLIGWGVTGRPWAAYLFGAVPALALAYGNYFKMVFRNDPVLFSDLLILVEAGDMAGKYTLYLNARLVFAALCAAGGFLFILLFVKGRPRAGGRVGALAAAVLICLLGARPYFSEELYNRTAVNLSLLNQWAATHLHVSRGSMYPFLYSAKEAFPSQPEGYDKKAAEELLSGYADAAIPEGEKVNVVGIMLEAFADFSEFESIEFAQDAYSVYHALEAESYTGDLVTNIFAGGTIDTERAFLTGCSTLYNWRSATGAYPWYFKSQGYETSGDHPFNDWFYNRKNVTEYLGFDTYRFVDNYYAQFTGGAMGYDDVFFREFTSDLLKRLDSGVPQFSFSVTYQGHGPYDSETCWWGEVDDYIANEELDEASRHILANYLGSVMDTQVRLAELVDTLREREEPVVLLVFGDHMPWLGNANSVYEALEVNFDLSTEEGFYNYWSTRYLIWANDAAKESLDFDFVGEGPDLSPCFLMGHLFDLVGWAGDGYTQATYDVRNTVPVLHNGGRYVENGVFTSALSEEGAELVSRFRMLEYYRSR